VRIRVPLSSHIAYITTVKAIATTATPKFRCVVAIAPDRLVVEEEGDAAPPVVVGDDAPVVALVGTVGTPVVWIPIEVVPVAPGILADGRGDCR
jgi:hypothetical protein